MATHEGGVDMTLWNLRLRIGAVAICVLILGGILSLLTMEYLLSQVEKQKEEVVGSSKQVLQDTYDKIINLEVKRSAEYQKEEEFVREVAHKVVADVERVLRKNYPDPNLVSDNILMEDKELKRAAIQWVEREPPDNIGVEEADDNRKGYTTLYAKEGGIMLHHAQERLNGQRLAERSGKADLLNWWRIYGGAIAGQEKEGYYLWPEADGSKTVKFWFALR
jgi:hypothetical protein